MNPRRPPIAMFDYREEYRALRGELLAAIERTLESGHLVLGPEVAAFEAAFAASLGGGGAVGVNSGTDALVVALRALGVGPGDEVVTVALTAVPTVSAIRETGATPVFCDVDERTALMDLDQVPEFLTERTRAVVPVHLYGNVVDVSRLRRLLGGRPVAIVEDCAQAHGARLRGALAGTLGDAAAFSFYPTKNLGAYGEGGLCWSADPALVERMRWLRMYGFRERNHAEIEGRNSRLDELQAAILAVKLPHLAARIQRRRTLAARYDEGLAPEIERVATATGVEHGRHLYVVQVPEREHVQARLAEQGIATGVHYPIPIHRMRTYRFLGCEVGQLPRTERLAARVLSLPLYPELPEASVDRVCEALNAAIGG